ncbi:serine/threonine-protein kinase Nek4 isoform X2 [Thalassophryne amazonica]|uniref:serine/threonine-protein kinase Nek4 isoform X2 n=1 Tax=Thalassophryne amazonica TaxID=390379 RepID=UPI001470CADF|nr:serine/threonine-protein kinase Nek4 isoform X2 [Thalassophryne amazonica]
MNNYSFIRVVGKGSYGEVNLVKHKTERKQYVIKKLNLITSTRRERRAAEQEACLLSQLRHPNIVTYRESWEGDDCKLYIVMGFCEGGDLYNRLKQQKGELLPERQVVEWFVQIAMALQYLHERNILHRDLKTQNVFLTKNNIIKVGDLGIARVLENQNDMASTLIGTPYYMSPELFSNKPYNQKSDVWALGCCVYEISTLKHAFNAKDMNSLVYRIVEGKLPQMPNKYDPQLAELIKNMLCKRPEDRPDVKIILRQPYIKRQIAIFLEATKEKTAKSRKKTVSGGIASRDNSASVQLKPERLPLSPQRDPLVRMKQKEKSQQLQSQNAVAQCHSAQTPPPCKSSSPDALKDSTVDLATASNINVDIQVQEDEHLVRKPVQKPHSTVSHHQDNSEPETDKVSKSSKRRRKPALSPVFSQQPPLLSISGIEIKEPEEIGVSDEPFDIHPQVKPDAGDTFSVFVDKQISDRDDKDDTMELLKEADIQNAKIKLQKHSDVSVSISKNRFGNRPNKENIADVLGVNMDDKNHTLMYSKEYNTSDIQVNPESTEKLLEPFPPVTAQVTLPRPLPPPPADTKATEARKKKNRLNTEYKKSGVAEDSTSVSSCQHGLLPLPAQDRLLSARERRRLKKSQDTTSLPGSVRRAFYDVTSFQAEHCNTPVYRSVSDSVTVVNSKDVFFEQRYDEDECSSSTSSTERSEGDCRERKTESNDMQDLVHMMTQTLRMDDGDGLNAVNRSTFGSSALPEFKLNRRYRDTLVLHGKADVEVEKLSLAEIPKGSTSGPAKIQRAIERLRTDVVKGLGIRLLDKVLLLMEEEDDTKQELCLRAEMGDKYQTYAVMVRQLKFLEDVACRV